MGRCPKCGKAFRGYICSCGYDFTRGYTELWTLNVLTSEDRENCLSPYELAEKLYRRAAYARALELFEKEAAKGSTDAMCYLGKMYEKGYGCRKNMSRALEWYERAADAGNMNAKERRDALKKESEPIQASPSYSSATVKQTAAKPEYTYKANNYNVNNYSYYSSAYGSATNTSKFGGILHILIGVIGGLSPVFSSIRLIVSDISVRLIISDISESDAAGLLLDPLLALLIGLPIIMAGIRVGTAKIKWGEDWMEKVKLGWLRVAAFYGAFCVFILGCCLLDQDMSLLPLSLSLDAMMLYCWMLSSVWFLITRMIIFINAG